VAGFAAGPSRDCDLCARLAAFRADNRQRLPDGFNAPVPAFGSPDARLVIVGLAPGLKGANFTGRPFTGDFAGDLLYETLLHFGFAEGAYAARADDGLALRDCAIVNAVRCVPPQNKPTPEEITNCRPFLIADLKRMQRLEVIVALGRIAHDSLVRAYGAKASRLPFSHGGEHKIDAGEATPTILLDSYHCSRYNTNTGVLTRAMFRAVFQRARILIDGGTV
jgi:uracil-DNA glycosylase